MKLSAYLLLLLVVFVSRVQAQIYPVLDLVWTGASSSAWSDPANWNPASLPTATQVVAVTTSTNNPVTITGNATAGSLLIGTGSGATGSVTVQGGGNLTLVPDENFFLGYGILGETAGSSGTLTVTGSNSTVNGYLVVGYDGTGTLNILNGATVTASEVDAVFGSGASATLNVIGANSTLNSTVVAYAGTLTVNISDGATVTGAVNLEHGNVTVSHATVSGGISVSADSGINIVTISDHSTVGGITLQASNDSTVTATVAGNSALGSIFLATSGTGTASLSLSSNNYTMSTVSVFGGNLSFASDTVLTSNNLSLGAGKVSFPGPGSQWTASSELLVGSFGHAATLEVSAGAKLTFGSVSLGKNGFGSVTTGNLNIDGTGSQLTSNSSLVVGDSGGVATTRGTMNITNGAAVSSATGAIGTNATGSVTINGPGSAWTVAGNLTLGAGNVTIANGATLNTAGTVTGNSTASQITLNGTGSSWNLTNNLELGATNLTVTNGATLNTTSTRAASVPIQLMINGTGSTWTNNGTFDVGNSAQGNIVVSNGGHLISTGGPFNLGLILGSSGNLTVQSGGTASLGTVTVGKFAGSSGSITVTGNGSSLTSTNQDISSAGNASLTISDGATVNNSGSTMIAGSGNVMVTDPGSQWTNGADTLFYGNGTLTIQAGARASSGLGIALGSLGRTTTATVTGNGSQWTTGGMAVGNGGNVSLTIADGAVVTASGISYIGGPNPSTPGFGNVTITGAGSTLNSTGSFEIGPNGNATLNIVAGASMTNTSVNVGANRSNNLALSVDGANSRWTSSGDVSLRNGTLTLSNGGTGSSDTTTFVYNGTLSVSGTNSSWTSPELYLGLNAGSANLTLADSGHLTTATSAYIASGSGANVNATMNGTGTVWTTGGMTIGDDGNGSLTVSGGAAVNASNIIFVAGRVGSHGNLTVTGAGSSVTTSRSLRIGYGANGGGGNATFTVSNGGSVQSNAETLLGWTESASALVTGTNSTWTSGAYMYLQNGSTLTVADGGKVVTPNSILLDNSTLNIGAGAGAGTVQANAIVSNSVGTINFNHSDSSYTFGSQLYFGGLRLTHSGPGTTILSYAGNTYGGGTTVSAGTLQLGADNALGTGPLTLSGGTLAMGGFSQGLGALTLFGSSTINFGTGTSGLLFADSAASSWTGTLSILNYTSGVDTLRFGTSSAGLTPTQLSLLDFGGGLLAQIDASGFVTAVSAIPEPGTYALFAGLAGLGLALHRRRAGSKL